MKKIRIGSRGSALALAQTYWVKASLEKVAPDYQFEVIEISTKGDRILDRPLAKVGGKGLFIKEIEQALLTGEIDLAVHSMKDMPAQLPDGLTIGAVTHREDPRDVLITRSDRSLSELPEGARIGTSSLRRKASLLAQRPDLKVVPLRGNINTRLQKLSDENLDGIILAAAGLSRMGWLDRVSDFLDPSVFIPAVGQGALAIENREDDLQIAQLVANLEHSPTRDAVTAERGVLERLEGSCQIPIGAYGEVDGSKVRLTGFVADTDGHIVIQKTLTGERNEAFQLGTHVAEMILDCGGGDILSRIKQELSKDEK